MKERRETAGSRRKRVASLLEKQIIDYKNPQLLRHFLTDRGKIVPARVSGLSARDQRRLTKAVKRARMLALLPYTSD